MATMKNTLINFANNPEFLTVENHPVALECAKKGGSQVASLYQNALIFGIRQLLAAENDGNNPQILVETLRAMVETRGYGEKTMARAAGWLCDVLPDRKVINSKKGLRIVQNEKYDGGRTLDTLKFEVPAVIEAANSLQWDAWTPPKKDQEETTAIEDITAAMEKVAKKHKISLIAVLSMMDEVKKREADAHRAMANKLDPKIERVEFTGPVATTG